MLLNMLFIGFVIFLGCVRVFVFDENFSFAEVEIWLLELFVAICDMRVWSEEHQNSTFYCQIESVHKSA